MYHQLSIPALSTLVRGHPVCILLDTARPSAEQRFSFVFLHPQHELCCDSFEQLPRLFETIDDIAKTRWIAGYLSYEAAYGFEARFDEFKKRHGRNNLAWFGVFNEPFIFDHLSGKWNRDPEAGILQKVPSPEASAIKLHHATTKKNYSSAVGKIRRLIASGDIYQANFTYDLSISGSSRAWDLYQSLRSRQPVSFGAFIKTKTTTIASFSPELFFMKQGRHIITRPMKGTSRRGRFNREDEIRAAALAADPKNRSENVMIVDLLRNDLGKICKTGSVKTTKLFDVERHPTVLQMTSTVEGVLKKETSLSSIFRALFPCGSVTGAPKIRAMEIIRELETGDRGVYCGAIGYSGPGKRSVFSVPIRTLVKKNDESTWRYRVGSGIVWDSKVSEEWQECRDKYRFLTVGEIEFQLLESILFNKQKLVYCDDHKKRVFDAADYFGFKASGKDWDEAIGAIKGKLRNQECPRKVRITLDKTGRFSWESELLKLPVGNTHYVAILARKSIDVDTPLLFHKTTYRPWYRDAMKSISKGGCFDVIHFNNEGQLTEGARSNLFVTINNQLYTPPVECGLLPGVLRGRMLRAGKCKERVLEIGDLEKAGKVYCGNSVRGMVEVTVVGVKK